MISAQFKAGRIGRPPYLRAFLVSCSGFFTSALIRFQVAVPMEEAPLAALAVATCEVLRVRAPVPVQKHAALMGLVALPREAQMQARGSAQARHEQPGPPALAASPCSAAGALLALVPDCLAGAQANVPCAQPQHFPWPPVLKKLVLRKPALKKPAKGRMLRSRMQKGPPLLHRRAACGPRQYC
jgi:hypothetical protein